MKVILVILILLHLHINFRKNIVNTYKNLAVIGILFNVYANLRIDIFSIESSNI